MCILLYNKNKNKNKNKIKGSKIKKISPLIFLILGACFIQKDHKTTGVEERTEYSLSMVNKDFIPVIIDISTIFSIDNEMKYWKCKTVAVYHELSIDKTRKEKILNHQITNTRKSEGILIIKHDQPNTVKYINPNANSHIALDIMPIPKAYKLYDQFVRQSKYQNSQREKLNDPLFFLLGEGGPKSSHSMKLEDFITLPEGKDSYPVLIKREGNKIHKIWTIEYPEPDGSTSYLITTPFENSNSI